MKKIELILGGFSVVLAIGAVFSGSLIALVAAIALGSVGALIAGLRLTPQDHVRPVVSAGFVTRLARGVTWILWPVEKLGPTIYTGTRFTPMVLEGVLTSDRISLEEFCLTVLYRVDPDQAANDMLSQVVFYSEAMWDQTIRVLTEGVVQAVFTSRRSGSVRDEGAWGAIRREIRNGLQNEVRRFGITIESNGVILTGVKLPENLENAIVAAEEVRIDSLTRAKALDSMRRMANAHPTEQFDIPLAIQLVQALCKNGASQLILSSSDFRNLLGLAGTSERQRGNGQRSE